MSMLQVDDSQFELEVIQSDLPVLAYFWAEWCGPCKATAPILEEFATAYEGKIKIAKINVDHANEVAVKFGIRGIPTIILFQGGESIATRPGAFTRSQLLAFIDSHL